jgi:DNA polymerase III gamma/tau subunit
MVREIDKKGINLQQFVKYCLIMLRDILIDKMKDTLDPKEYSFAVDLSLQQILSLINYFLVADRNLRNSPIPALELEMIIGAVDFTEHKSVESPKPLPKKPEEKKPVKVVKEDKKEDDKVVERKINLKEEKIVEKEPENSVEFAKDLDVSVIKQNWKILTKKIQPANGHLFAFLERVNILGFENDKLQLEVPFQFHKDRIEDPKSREAIYLVCKEVYGKQFAFECVVNDNIKNKKKVEPDFILNKISESIKPQEVKVEKPADGGKEVYKQKVSKDIEAIFEDM